MGGRFVGELHRFSPIWPTISLNVGLVVLCRIYVEPADADFFEVGGQGFKFFKGANFFCCGWLLKGVQVFRL